MWLPLPPRTRRIQAKIGEPAGRLLGLRTGLPLAPRVSGYGGHHHQISLRPAAPSRAAEATAVPPLSVTGSFSVPMQEPINRVGSPSFGIYLLPGQTAFLQVTHGLYVCTWPSQRPRPMIPEEDLRGTMRQAEVRWTPAESPLAMPKMTLC